MTLDYQTPQARCFFALAQAEITPPIGIYHRMWGAATHERSEGVHRPLFAQVMLLSSPKEARYVVSLDHCLFGAAEIRQLREWVQRETGVTAEELFVTFTHTHGAGLMSLDRVDLPGGDLIPPYLDQIARTVSQLVQEVRQQLAPASIQFAPGLCTLARNRDFWDEGSQQWICGFNPAAEIDPRFWTAKVHAYSEQPGAGRLLATIVNYACHPTTLAWENRLISPDFIGALRETMQANTGGAPCLFLQGASADLGPREGFVGDPAIADKNGRELAFAALSALTALPPPDTRFVYQGPVVSGATLGDWRNQPLTAVQARAAVNFKASRTELNLPYRAEFPSREVAEAALAQHTAAEQASRTRGDEAAARDARAHVERQTRLLRRLSELPLGAYSYPVHVWRIGEAVWLFLPGELYSAVFRELSARFPGRPLFITTLLDGWGPSYLPPRAMYNSGRYQESIAVVAPGSLEQIIDSAAEQIERLFGGGE